MFFEDKLNGMTKCTKEGWLFLTFFVPFIQMRDGKSFFQSLFNGKVMISVYLLWTPHIIKCFVKCWDKHFNDVVDNE